MARDSVCIVEKKTHLHHTKLFFLSENDSTFLVIKNVFFLTGYTTRLNILQKIYEK